MGLKVIFFSHMAISCWFVLYVASFEEVGILNNREYVVVIFL